MSADAGDELMLVLCNAPPEHAEAIARAIISARVAACVNVVPAVTSYYMWQEKLAVDAENTLLIKTRRSLVAELCDVIRGVHPYELPEIIALPIASDVGNLAYHQWLLDETRRPKKQP